MAGQTSDQIGINEVDSSPTCGKPDNTRINSVVLMTDGMDTNSTTYHSVSQLMSDIGRTSEKSADVSIYTIGYGKDADESVLAPIAKQAGGDYRKAPTAQDIQSVYRDISTFF
jgi:Ca-activated chloride channel family protein